MASISNDILASYAADAALEVDGVQRLVESALPRSKGVRVLDEDGRVQVEVQLALVWGAPIPSVGAAVQRRVADYLSRMADIEAVRVDVVIAEIGPP